MMKHAFFSECTSLNLLLGKASEAVNASYVSLFDACLDEFELESTSSI